MRLAFTPEAGTPVPPFESGRSPGANRSCPKFRDQTIRQREASGMKQTRQGNATVDGDGAACHKVQRDTERERGELARDLAVLIRRKLRRAAAVTDEEAGAATNNAETPPS
jgi:hypothetical protein